MLDQMAIRPGMYVSPGSFNAVCGFLQGFDVALGGEPLAGFRDWLALRLEVGEGLGWPGLVSYHVLSRDADEETKVLGLCRLVAEFLDFRAAVGRERVVGDYAAWRRSKGWA